MQPVLPGLPPINNQRRLPKRALSAWSTHASVRSVGSRLTSYAGLSLFLLSLLTTSTWAQPNGPACGSYTNRSTAHGLGNNLVAGVYAQGSTIYAATSAGLSISTDGGQSFANKTTTQGLGDNFVNGVYAQGSTVYTATNGGLSISTDGGQSFANKTSITNNLGSNLVYGVYALGSTVYAATDGGLSISTDGGQNFTNYTTYSTHNGLGADLVYGVYAQGSTVYAATSGGLSVSTDGGQNFNTYTVNDGLGSDFVNGVYAQGSTVYAATKNGLGISTDGSHFANITTAHGLGADFITGVYAQGSTVYAATSEGLSISTNGGQNFTNYTTTDGLGSNSVNGVYAQGSTVYAATVEGLSFCSSLSPPALTNLTASPNPVCAGLPILFSAQVVNKMGAYNYVLTNGSTSVSGSASSPTFSQTLTASGSGIQTFTLTVSNNDGSATATVDVTVNVSPAASLTASGPLSPANPIVTLTASPGAAAYIFSTGATQVNSGNTATVTTPGFYSVTLTGSNGCSATAITTVIAVPDLTPIISVRPSTVYGTTPITVVVDVIEISGVATTGLITVKITSDSNVNLNFNSGTTSVSGRPVQNSVWTLSGPSSGFYTLTTNQAISGGDVLSVGLTGTLTPGDTQGTLTVSTLIGGGSGGETRFDNNSNANKIDYFSRY